MIKSQQVQGGRLALDYGFLNTAPVSHQKRRYRNTTDATERVRKHSKINEGDRHSAAHKGLVAGSSPAGPTTHNMILYVILWFRPNRRQFQN
jgi:hypothetical protein